MAPVPSAAAIGNRVTRLWTLVALVFVSMAFGAVAATAATLDQIKQTGRLRLGYREDARPLSYKDESGKPAGYSVALCQQIADAIKAKLSLSQLAIEWVPVTLDNRFSAVQKGQVDLLCGADSTTLARREEVSFSIATFPGGIGALVRADAPARLRDALNGRTGQTRPIWRGTVDPTLNAGRFAAVGGTTGEQWLNTTLRQLQIRAEAVTVPNYQAGVQQVVDRKANVMFGDRALLLSAAHRNAASEDVTLLDRRFTYEPLAIALPRGDEDLRLLVDTTLSRLYRSGQAATLYAKYIAEPDAETLLFFRVSAIPD